MPKQPPSRPPRKKALYRDPLPAPPEAEPSPNIGHPLDLARFELREDGSISPAGQEDGPRLVFRSETPFVRLYHGNCLDLLDANRPVRDKMTRDLGFLMHVGKGCWNFEATI